MDRIGNDKPGAPADGASGDTATDHVFRQLEDETELLEVARRKGVRPASVARSAVAAAVASRLTPEEKRAAAAEFRSENAQMLEADHKRIEQHGPYLQKWQVLEFGQGPGSTEEGSGDG